MDARELKGMQIAATMPLRRDSRGWIVPSQTGVGTYRVVPAPTTTYKVAQGLAPSPNGIQPWGCDCPDFLLRNQPCKHVIAVELTVRRETVDVDGSVVTEELKVTYTQNWGAYNAAQCAEKDLFLPMLANLCGTLSRPYKGRGRPSLPMSDMTYSTIAKVYSGMSARRFDSDVREASDRGLTEVDPHFNTVLRYLRNPEMTPHLERLVTLSALPMLGVETMFAQDSTGFSTGTYARWFDHKWGKEQRKAEYVKLHAMTGVLTNIVTDATVTDLRGADSPQFIPLLNRTAQNFNMVEVSADKAYSSKANLQAVADLGATPFVPFKATSVGPVPSLRDPSAVAPGPEASAWAKMYHQFTYQRDTFLAHYHRRSNVETTFSMIKAKFGGSLKSKSQAGQFNEVLCKVICHNLVCIISAIYEMGFEHPQFAVELAG